MDQMELKYVSIKEAPKFIMETIVPVNIKFENKIENCFKEFKNE
jgi:hypothetical protein